MLRRLLPWSLVLVCAMAWGQSAPTAQPKSGTPPPKSGPPPRSEPIQDPNESSSRDTQIDITDRSLQFPADRNEGEESADSDVQEMKPYDPHRAEKNVEVGDYLMRRKSYRAAESRYREALEYKPNDALATFRLAVVLEKSGQLEEAWQRYQEYLKILPQGPFAKDCRKALARLKPRKDSPKQTSRATSPPSETRP
jgi:tetratricopeptide (TPR) repeat protein